MPRSCGCLVMTEADDRQEWGKSENEKSTPVNSHDEQDVFVVTVSHDWRKSLAEAWPVIQKVLIIFGFMLLAVNALSWSIAQTPTRWPPLLMSVIFFLVAAEKGNRQQSIQFLFFYLVGLITALWI